MKKRIDTIRERFSCGDSFQSANNESEITVLNHGGGTQGRCRVFFSFIDYEDFSFEHPGYSGVEKSFILGSLDNLSKLKELIVGYAEVFSYQCRYLDGHRFVWAHGYTEEKIDAFLAEFRHDHYDLLAWQPDKEPLSISGKEVLM